MDHTEAGKEIRRAVDTGKVEFGTKESIYTLRHGNGELLVVARNMPVMVMEDLRHIATLSNVPVYTFAGTGHELGAVCGKPYVISTLLIVDAGKSRVTELKDASPKTGEINVESKKGRSKKAAN